VSRGAVTGTPVPWRVIARRFQRQALSPRVETVSDVNRRVQICLIRRHPTAVVGATKLRLTRARSDVGARMARLRRVRWIDVLDRDASIEGFVLDTVLQSGERPCVKTTVHPLSAVQRLTDVRQIFEDNYWLLKLSGVLDGLSARLLDNIRECVLVVVGTLVNPPIGGVTLSKTTERREHLFPKMSRVSTVNEQWVLWSTALDGTADEQRRFTHIEADRCRLFRRFLLRYTVFDGDVQCPRRSGLAQSELAYRHVTIVEAIPQLPLIGIDAKRYPKRGAAPSLWNAPAELVGPIGRVIQFPTPVREPDWMIVSQFLGVVRIVELRDVGLERVLSVGREVVVRDDIVDCRARLRTTIERVRKGTAIRGHGSLKASLFVCRWRYERGLKRFRGRGTHTNVNEGVIVKDNELLSSRVDAEPEYRGQRGGVRATERSQRRSRAYVARIGVTRSKSARQRRATRIVNTRSRVRSRSVPQRSVP